MILARDNQGKTWWLIRPQRSKNVLATKDSPEKAVSVPASQFKKDDLSKLKELRKEKKG